MATIKYRTSSIAPWITLTNVDSTQPSDALPLMDGVANAGTSDTYARGDHKHPSDTSRANTNLSNLSDNNEALKNLGAMSNFNLLNNPWFTVNQRNITSKHTTTEEYTSDRWKMLRCIADYSNDTGWSMAWDGANGDNGTLYQVLPNPEIYGKTMTVSVLTNSGVYSYTDIFTMGTIKTSQRFFNSLLLEFNGSIASAPRIFIRVYTQTPVVIRAVKLEYGSVSTLANDHMPNPAEELLKCRSSKADPADPYANGNNIMSQDALSLEEIAASTDLSGKVASAHAGKTLYDALRTHISHDYLALRSVYGSGSNPINIDQIHNGNGYIYRCSTTTGVFSGTSPTNILGGNAFLLIGFSVVLDNGLVQYGVQLAIGFGSNKIAIRNAPYNASGGSWGAWRGI